MPSRRCFLVETGALTLAVAGGLSLPESWGQEPAEKPYLKWPKDRLPTRGEIRQMHPFLWHVVDLLNAYRKQHGLPEVPLSPKLTLVAKKHVEDLVTHRPHTKCKENLHAWSSIGNWKGGCFDLADKKSYAIMWDKPKEIAGYNSHGFEIAAMGTLGDKPHLTYDGAMKSWQGSSAHNDVILNKGIWKDRKWNALGAACALGFACAWFGTLEDA